MNGDHIRLILFSILFHLSCLDSIPLETFDRSVYQNSMDDDYAYVNDNPVIEVDDGAVPLCPPAVRPYNPKLCNLKRCHTDSDCPKRSDQICCFNGCIRTCVAKMSPPPFFDWDDHEQDMSNNILAVGRKNLAEAELLRPAVIVTLPGDCHLTQEQFKSLEHFQKSPNVMQCYCKNGDVFCDIKMTNQSLSRL